MKKILMIALLVAIVAGLSLPGCKPDPAVVIAPPDTSGNISFAIPSGFPQPSYTFANNQLTQSGFELGRKLFYDPRLSKDNTISCGTCHQQYAAFSNFDHALSHGIYNQYGHRNTPALFNIAWEPSFFWDGGVNNIENQPINPMQNPVEMDLPLAEALTKISADATYKSMFTKAFGSDTVNSQRMFRALAQFMAAMVSSNSKYDKYIRGESGGTLSTEELHGLSLVREKCEGCHKEPLFTDFSFRNNGLSIDANLNDSGRAHVTLAAGDMHSFKVPSLRNIMLTQPYMHDGRFTTVDAVIEHYRTGIYQWPNVDTLVKNGITMSDQDKADIISFLKTLSDDAFTHDPRFSDPN